MGLGLWLEGALGVEDGSLGTQIGEPGGGGCFLWSPAVDLSAAGCCRGPARAWLSSRLPRLVDFVTIILGWEGTGVLRATFPSRSGDPASCQLGSRALPPGSLAHAEERCRAGSLLLGELERDAQSSLDCTLCLKNLGTGRAFWESAQATLCHQTGQCFTKSRQLVGV